MRDHEFLKSVGECVRPVDVALLYTSTVKESMLLIRKKLTAHQIIYFYAVDDQGSLKGVVSTRQLLIADPDATIESVMLKSVVKLNASQSMREALEFFEKHSLLALPVVNREGVLLGSIDLQMVLNEPINTADQQSRTDAFQMIGITLEEKRRIPLRKNYRNRMPWLLCNVFSGLMCALISRIFELVLSKVLLLAFFIPLVLTLSESTSMQSMAQSLQFLRRPRFHWRSIKLRAYREWQLAALIAISLALLVAALSLFWGGEWRASISIGIGIFLGVCGSAAFGIAVPIFLNRMRLDPRVASGPLVLMIVDIFATAVYLGLATLWLV